MRLMTMLQFSATLYTATTRLTLRSSWRFTTLIANNSSTVVTSEQPSLSVKENEDVKFSEIEKNILQDEETKSSKQIKSKIKFNPPVKNFINGNDTFVKYFQSASTVNELLDLATLPNLSVNDALKLISSITNQINSGNSQIINIEADQRFINLSKIVKNNANTLNEDLSQYTQLSTPAMISVIVSLREQGNRNTPLLRMLSYNIVKYNASLNIKQCATLLYSMAVLNFPDKILLEKVMFDLLRCIPTSTNAVTNKSIITSLGFLHYKNENVLDAFCDRLFVESNYKLRDYSSILQTFAALRYKSEKAAVFMEKFAQQVSSFQVSSIEWLDIIWSLAVLDIVHPWQVKSILQPTFVEKLNVSSKFNISKQLKLLNINGVARFVLKDYTEPFLKDDSEVFNRMSLVRAKNKQTYIDALSETLKNILPSQDYFKMDVNTNMGFLLDAEYHINDQHNPIPVKDWNVDSSNTRRVAIMIHDYNDYCRGQNDLIGSIYLHTQLLKAKGYDLVTVSYENFSIQDKIEKRINYLKERMKCLKIKRSI